jgi:hypothetical protein
MYIDMLGVPSLHHEHHAIYIDMLRVPSQCCMIRLGHPSISIYKVQHVMYGVV